MSSFSQLPPLSLYIHFPWCVQKCPYCDFNSHQQKTTLPENQYIDALLNDLELDLPLIWGRKISSIFMGGGTPSLFSANSLDTLLAGIRARIPLLPNAEISLEANPGTLENERLFEYREIGINRVSLGVQSFHDEYLEKLGRIHNSETAINAIEKAKQANFDSFNIDLMFGLPGQSLEQAKYDIEKAISFSPNHLSYYQLTIEPNTAFYNSPPVLPDDENCWSIYQNGLAILLENGYAQYEVSAYAKKNQQCRHNMNYWQFGDYLGIGAGAHAKITDANKQSITRYWKLKHPKDYLTQSAISPVAGSREVTGNELVFEFLMNALRLNAGFTLDAFCLRTGLLENQLRERLNKSIHQNLVSWDEQKNLVRTTDRGKQFLNEILQDCLPE